MLKTTLLALLIPALLLAACGGEPAGPPENMPPRAMSGEPTETYELSLVVVEGQPAEVMQVEIFEAGTGREAQLGDALQVHYTGWVKNSALEFDSSYVRGSPITIKRLGAGKVIPGWELGLEGMAEGTRARLRIPPALGYGARGMPPVIPGNADLVFDIELVTVL